MKSAAATSDDGRYALLAHSRKPAGRSTGPVSGSLHAMVLNEIGQAIVRGDLAPGDPLPNADDWSAMQGVSRTVLREVIKVLAGKGLIEARPRTGTRVRPRTHWNFLDPDVLAWRYGTASSRDDARALFELRRAIEPMAAELAAGRAGPPQIKELEDLLAEMEHVADDGERFTVPDLAFHQAILRMTGNELMGSLAALIETALLMSFRLSNENPRGNRHSMPLHRKVAARIAAGDGAGARRAMLTLIDDAEIDVAQAIAVRQRRRK
jgi:DNA-binding FadR family transcriptional regulator